MSKIITLKWPAVCSDCGAELPAGTKAKYYNPRHIYGLDCHSRESSNQPRVTTFTTSGGTFTRCNCEDYPCCGH